MSDPGPPVGHAEGRGAARRRPVPLEVGPIALSGGVLVLRPPRFADFPQWREVRLRNEQAMRRFWPTTSEPWEDLHTEWRWLQEVADHREGVRAGSEVALVMEVDGRLAGQVNLTGMDPLHRSAELGVWTDRHVARRHVALAAACATFDLAFTRLGLEAVTAPGDTRNRPALALAHHIGMVKEATMRGYSHVDGAWRDHHLMTVLPSDRPAEGFLAAGLGGVGEARSPAPVRPGRRPDPWPASWSGRTDLARHRARQARDRLARRRGGRGPAAPGEDAEGAEGIVVDGRRVPCGVRDHDRAHSLAEVYVDGPVSEDVARTAVRHAVARALDDLGVHRVTALAVPGDEVRASAYAAAGLQREGTLRSRLRPDGTRGALDLWARLADDPTPAADPTL